jgi:hypothetical protein
MPSNWCLHRWVGMYYLVGSSQPLSWRGSHGSWDTTTLSWHNPCWYNHCMTNLNYPKESLPEHQPNQTRHHHSSKNMIKWAERWRPTIDQEGERWFIFSDGQDQNVGIQYEIYHVTWTSQPEWIHITTMHRVMKYLIASSREKGLYIRPDQHWDGRNKNFEFEISGMADSCSILGSTTVQSRVWCRGHTDAAMDSECRCPFKKMAARRLCERHRWQPPISK